MELKLRLFLIHNEKIISQCTIFPPIGQPCVKHNYQTFGVPANNTLKKVIFRDIKICILLKIFIKLCSLVERHFETIYCLQILELFLSRKWKYTRVLFRNFCSYPHLVSEPWTVIAPYEYKTQAYFCSAFIFIKSTKLRSYKEERMQERS